MFNFLYNLLNDIADAIFYGIVSILCLVALALIVAMLFL